MTTASTARPIRLSRIHCRELEELDPLLPMGLARAKRSDRHARTFRRLSAANQEEKP